MTPTPGLVADIFAGVFTVAVLYVLARPKSKAAEMIRLASNAVVAIVKTATDL
jgi:hypothetical protein